MKLQQCTVCKQNAIIYLKDLKVKGDKSKLFLCEKDFKAFCFGLIKGKVNYDELSRKTTKI